MLASPNEESEEDLIDFLSFLKTQNDAQATKSEFRHICNIASIFSYPSFAEPSADLKPKKKRRKKEPRPKIVPM